MGDGAGGNDGASAFSSLLGLLMTLSSGEKLGVDFAGAAETPESRAMIEAVKEPAKEPDGVDRWLEQNAAPKSTHTTRRKRDPRK